MGLELQTTQKQRVSQNVIQRVTVLQMNGLELTDYIKELSLENPLVEIEENGTDTEDKVRLEKLEWLSEFDEQNRIYVWEDQEDSDKGDILNLGQSQEELLEDILIMQIPGLANSKEDRIILEYLIKSLDQRGYFTDSVADAAVHLGTTEEHIHNCLNLLQSMEPSGIGAGSLTECLLIQLERLEHGEEYAIEKEVVKNHLESIGKNYFQIIAKKMGISVERVEQAAAVIKSLNPKPANGYGQRGNVNYVKPDIVVINNEGSVEIRIDEYSYPTLKVNRDYMRLLRDDECSLEVQQYISGKARQIEQVQGYIQKRHDTLFRLSGFLVECQSEFFRMGPGHLHSLKMQEMADYMEVHESTVSRAVREKYLQCSWGIFPLEYFFSKAGFEGSNAQVLASDQIKEVLKELIDAENKKKPLSDQKLAEQMNEQGISISRRTVAKYREEMKIPDCRGRKTFCDN
ncbi:MAG: RNA polymerase factor sigma-54 [Oliverpabstia sp.]